jgi:hypothetical protein
MDRGRAFMTDRPEAIAKAVREAVTAYRERSDPDLGRALVDLYAAVLRLEAPATRIRNIVKDTGQNGVLSADEQAVFLRFFDLAKEFDVTLSHVDIGVLDIYQPGLVPALVEVTGGDYDVQHYFNGELAPRFGLDPQQLPVGLDHFMASYSGDVGYDSERQILELKSEYIGGTIWDWYFADRDPQAKLPDFALRHSVQIDPDKLARLDRLCSALLEVRELLGKLVRDNWTLAELAEARKVPVEVVMGDKFSNISDSTIVNRSIVEKSFVKFEREDPELAQALREVAAQIESSGSESAGELFDAFNAELQQPEPKKPVLASLWNGIVAAVPTIKDMTEIVTRIAALFT